MVVAIKRTIPVDIGGIVASEGILAREGGTTFHAGMSSLRMGKTCVPVCRMLMIDEKARIRRNDSPTISPRPFDGGTIFCGQVRHYP